MGTEQELIEAIFYLFEKSRTIFIYILLIFQSSESSAVGSFLLFSIKFEVETVTTTISLAPKLNVLISCDLKVEKNPHGKRV